MPTIAVTVPWWTFVSVTRTEARAPAPVTRRARVAAATSATCSRRRPGVVLIRLPIPHQPRNARMWSPHEVVETAIGLERWWEGAGP